MTDREVQHKSSSSSANVGLLEKIKYNYKLFLLKCAEDYDWAEEAQEKAKTIASTYEKYTGKSCGTATMLEIGFGARPCLSHALSLYFNKVIAVDLDAPILGASDLVRPFIRNGFERGVKSLIRYACFDSRRWKVFHERMNAASKEYDKRSVSFVVADACSSKFWGDVGEKFDLIYSTDVFEHIPKDALTKLLRHSSAGLKEDGLLITRPMVFTGICGGHNLEWYPQYVHTNSSESAWGHLACSDFTTNTYLNKVTRREYVELFSAAGFAMLQDEAVLGRLGEQHLGTERRAQLSGYDEYELFSNVVEFVLRPGRQEARL